MSSFFQALEQGYAPEEILGYLSKSIPQMSKPIKKAQKAGYTVQQILGFLSKNFDQQDRRGMTETERHTANRKADAERTKYGLKIAASAVAAPIAGIAARSALARSLPSSIQKALPGIAGQSSMYNPSEQPQNATPLEPTQQTLQQTDQLLDSSQQPPIQNVNNVTSVTQPQQTSQPEGITSQEPSIQKQSSKETDELWTRLEKGVKNHPNKDVSAFLKIADDLKKYQGMSRDQFDELFQDFSSKRQAGVPFSKIAKEMFGSYKQGNINAQTVQQPSLLSEELSQDNQEIERKPIAKSETVSTPHGIGEVKEIRNGQAIIDVDGKLHKVKEEELEVAPLPQKDLAALYDELIEGIEGETGEDVSRMVQWAGYNPETNTLQFLPHTGKLYKYGNISPEDAALLRDILSTRKTSGENFIGAWKAGSKSPIGAALSKLIRKLQSERGGKGSEYEETHESIYSAYEPAVQAAKKKKKKK